MTTLQRFFIFFLTALLVFQTPGLLPVQAAAKEPVVRGLSSVSNVKGGATLVLTVRISAPAPSGGTRVPLHSNRPSVIAVPATVLIPRGQTASTVTLPIKDVVNDVTVTISSTFPGGKRTKVVHVRGPKPLQFTGAASVTESTQGEFQVLIDRPGRTNGTDIDLISSNPAVLRVPQHAEARKGERAARVFYTAYRVNADTPVTLTARLNGSSIDLVVTVKAKKQVETFYVFHTNRANIEITGASTVVFNPAPKPGETATVVSSDPSIFRIDTPQPIAFSGTSAQFTYTTFGEGTVTLTATVRGKSVTREITVVPPQLQYASVPTIVGLPGHANANLTFFQAAGRSGTIIHLTSSDPGILEVPDSITIPPNGISGSFQMKALTQGNVVLTMTIGSFVRTWNVSVVPAKVSLNTIYDEYGPGERIQVRFSVNTSSPRDALISFASSDPAVVSGPETVRAETSGYVYFTAHKAGTVILTATINGTSTTIELRVTESPTLQCVCWLHALYGPDVVHYFCMTAPAPEATYVQMFSSNQSIVPDQVILVPKGSRNGYFALNARSNGKVTLTLVHPSNTLTYELTISGITAIPDDPFAGSIEPTETSLPEKSPTPTVTLTPTTDAQPSETPSPVSTPTYAVDASPTATGEATQIATETTLPVLTSTVSGIGPEPTSTASPVPAPAEDLAA